MVDFYDALLSRIQAKEVTVAVCGLGHVGLPMAMAAAAAGFRVLAIDVDEEHVNRLRRGQVHTPDVTNDELAVALRSTQFQVVMDYSLLGKADVVLVCVPTPIDTNKVPNTQYLMAVLKEIESHSREGQIIILESTSYPGTTEELFVPIAQRRGLRLGQDLFLAFSGERIDPGNSNHTVLSIPKVVGGVTPRCSQIAKTFYSTLGMIEVYVTSSPRAAEMVKLLENTFRFVNISLINDLAVNCAQMGIDIWEVIEAAKTKPFGFMPFYPGPGIGGQCIPVDPFYLAWKARELSLSTPFIQLAGEINDRMPEHVIAEVTTLLNEQNKSLRGSQVLLIGIAYKRGVSAVSESPAVKVATKLLQRGASLVYHDPFVREVPLDGALFASQPLIPELVSGSDLVLVCTAHPGVDYSLIVDCAPLIYDTTNAMAAFQSPRIRRLGAPAPDQDADPPMYEAKVPASAHGTRYQ